jgi:hypothetical protein
MNLTPQAMAKEVAATGLGAAPLEKVFRLMALFDALNSHPFLKTRIALKGGTALNLFHYEVPRLSVDIDLNYIGTVDRETMLAERPKVDQAVQAVCSREGLAVQRVPVDRSGGKWRLTFTGVRAQRWASASASLANRRRDTLAGHPPTLLRPLPSQALGEEYLE